MITREYHMHTTYCDGSNTPEEMVRAAIDKGYTEIGFSGHSHTFFDEGYCMSREGAARYRAELEELRARYRERISLRIGVEQDYYSEADPADYEYAIGSVHYVRMPACAGAPPEGVLRAGLSGSTDAVLAGPVPDRVPASGTGQWDYIPVDESGALQLAAADRYFQGDMIRFAEAYFETVADVVRRTGCRIIGHFDLIAKFNEGNRLFDEKDPRYVAAWQRAVRQLLPYGIPFEINTGAMSKGYRSQPYPADPIRTFIRSRGGHFILSSDSHRTDTLGYGFERFEAEADRYALPEMREMT